MSYACSSIPHGPPLTYLSFLFIFFPMPVDPSVLSLSWITGCAQYHRKNQFKIYDHSDSPAPFIINGIIPKEKKRKGIWIWIQSSLAFHKFDLSASSPVQSLLNCDPAIHFLHCYNIKKHNPIPFPVFSCPSKMIRKCFNSLYLFPAMSEVAWTMRDQLAVISEELCQVS